MKLYKYEKKKHNVSRGWFYSVTFKVSVLNVKTLKTFIRVSEFLNEMKKWESFEYFISVGAFCFEFVKCN